MRKIKVYLTNGEIADISLEFNNNQEFREWVDSVVSRGIHTEESYIPHHAIYYILFEGVPGKVIDNVEVKLGAIES